MDTLPFHIHQHNVLGFHGVIVASARRYGYQLSPIWFSETLAHITRGAHHQTFLIHLPGYLKHFDLLHFPHVYIISSPGLVQPSGGFQSPLVVPSVFLSHACPG